MWVGPPLINWRPKQNKKENKKRELLLPVGLHMQHWSFPDFECDNGTHWLLLGLCLPALQLEFVPLALQLLRSSDPDWSYTIAFPGSLPCWMQILGLLSPHSHVAQFFIINLSICRHLYIYILLVLFPWKTLIQMAIHTRGPFSL